MKLNTFAFFAGGSCDASGGRWTDDVDDESSCIIIDDAFDFVDAELVGAKICISHTIVALMS